jgi:hypothetical protein
LLEKADQLGSLVSRHAAGHPERDSHSILGGRLLPPLIAVLVFINRRRLREFVLDEAVLEFFAGDASCLECSWVFNERWRARHNLARTPRG